MSDPALGGYPDGAKKRRRKGRNPALKKRLAKRDGLCCYLCGEKFNGIHDPNLSIDHVIPLSRGGDNDESNMALACGPHNKEKGSMSAEDYILMKGWEWPWWW